MHFTSIILLIAGFVILIAGADLLVKGASSIARRLRISELVIGLTVVAFGTSCPELFVNLTASLKGNTDIAIGNILGSNIANVLLILGISSLIYPLSVTRGAVWREIPFSLLAALVLAFMANDRLIDHAPASVLTRIDGLVLGAFFIIFMYYLSTQALRDARNSETQGPPETVAIPKATALVLIGLGALTLGGDWIVKGAVDMAQKLGLSEAIIGLTIVAIGTSLPELATSAVAAWRKNPEIAIGNVVGSNIFNIFFILAISSVIKPLPFDASANIDILMLLVSSVLLFCVMFTGRKLFLDRWEGGFFVVLYAGYLVFRISWS